MKNSSAVRRKVLLLYVTTWMNLKNIKLSEGCQMQKAACYSHEMSRSTTHLLFIGCLEKAHLLRQKADHSSLGLGVGAGINCKRTQGTF